MCKQLLLRTPTSPQLFHHHQIPSSPNILLSYIILLSGTFIAAPITVAWLAGNTPEPGKRAVVLGINGWGNLGGVLGSELFLARYGPSYVFPLKITTGLIAASFAGYLAYYFELKGWNKYKARKIASMTEEEIEAEHTNAVRYADKKWTFVYGV